MSNHAHPAVLLRHKPPIESAAKVKGGEEKDENQLEKTNKLSSKGMGRLRVIKPVDQDHLVLVPVEDCGAEARRHKAVDATAWPKQDGIVEDVVGEGTGDDAGEEQDKDPPGSVAHLQQAGCEHLEQHVGDDVRGVEVNKGVGHISPGLIPEITPPEIKALCRAESG